MCGISGFNWKDEHKIGEMISALSYRGPDSNGVFVEDGISLGHNRLSIIDLSKEANQPMSDNSGELTIVYNGEIYNFQELKKELEGEYMFKTRSDTEVILAGYRKWGKEVVERLNGMFSFAIWDRRDQSIFCSRDHLGMKPFYYFWDEKKFIFASEISAILKHDIPRKLDKDSFNHYMRILYTPEPMTMIENVYKLPPSHTLYFKGGLLSVNVYGQEDTHLTSLSYKEATHVLRDKVIKAVERHLIADVPIGVYLSGGIDSSVALFSMSQVRNDIQTFTIGFDLEDKREEIKFNHDFELAKKTAEYFGSEHNAVVISTKDVINSLNTVAVHNSDPVSNPTSIAMFLLAKFAKNKVTVALTGNAGDELFGGYDRYRTALTARILYNTPNLFAKFMFQKDDVLRRVVYNHAFMPTPGIKLYYNKYLTGSNAVEALMSADRQSWLPEHFFMLSDKMSMASSLEERMPLADKELLSFARSLPCSYKVDLFRTKKILKDAFKNDLPKFLFNQPKRGWFSPAAKWLRNPEFAQVTKEILSGNYYSETETLFNWQEVQNMLTRHVNKEEYNLTMIWAILTFQIWARQYEIEI